jgi:hypothetical protein
MSISISAAHNRILVDGDPTQRELWISLGICIETILLATKELGHTATLKELQTDNPTTPIATILITPGSRPIDQSVTLNAIQNRHSYRGPLQPIKLPNSLLLNCNDAIADLGGTSVHLVSNKADIMSIADLTHKGMRLALSSPRFRHELADLIHYNWSTARSGMHGFVLNRGPIGSIWEKWSVKLGLDVRQKANADRLKVSTASGLLFVATEGDVPHYWLKAGRAYCRISLVITQASLAQSTIAAPVEAASFHEDVERLLNTRHRIQTMTRVGKASRVQKKFSPRLSLEELLT